MYIDAATAFSFADLAVFDAARLRQVIGDASGAVAPALIGRAFASVPFDDSPSLLAAHAGFPGVG